MKNKLLVLIISLILTVLLSVGSLLAWFYGTRESIDNILVTTGKMAVNVELFKGVDYDKDGILDLDENNQPKYESLTVTNESGLKNTAPIIVNNLHVNEKVSFRLKIINEGTYDGDVMISINTISEDGIKRGLLQQVMVVESLTNVTANTIQSLNKPDGTINNPEIKTPIVMFGDTIPTLNEQVPNINVGYFDFVFYIADISLLNVLQQYNQEMTEAYYNRLMSDGSLFNKGLKINLISVDLQQKI